MSVRRRDARQGAWAARILVAVLLLWAGVTLYVFAFHYHPCEDDCANFDCPVLIVLLNLPTLPVALYVFSVAAIHHCVPVFLPIPIPSSFVCHNAQRAPPCTSSCAPFADVHGRPPAVRACACSGVAEG